MENPTNLTIYHSPDADDAFMFYGLSSGAVKSANYNILHELSDIETLNQRTLKGEIDCTAISVAAFPFVQDDYLILRSGASMGGESYGPLVISSDQAVKLDSESSNIKVALPGPRTSATLAFNIYCHENKIKYEPIYCPFNEVGEMVKNGSVEFGVIIHEGQLTHKAEGFNGVVDLGKWWWDTRKLPLPLGINVVKKKLGDDAISAIYQALRSSIEYGLANREQALEYALKFGRGLSKADADRFVEMYVNNYTIDLGEEGIESIELFLEAGAEIGLIPPCNTIEFLSASS